jgi:hypothetical protein
VRLVLSLIVVAAAACGGKQSSSGPAWPESAGTVIPDDYKEDGGESLEPKVASSVEASGKPEPAKTTDVKKPDDKKPDDKKPDDKKPDDKKPDEKPAETTPTPPVLEEIIIEIKD